MTIDDDNSIYVGGIPYDSTEDSIRKVFDLYGAIVAIKIINDHEVGGKCYGFVTFTNPRSAIDAINDMNGRTIGGRVVKVNEVRTRGGRRNFNRGNSRRDSERDTDFDRGRNRERDHDLNWDRYRDRKSDRSRDRDLERDREYDRACDHDRTRDRFLGRNQDRENDREDSAQERSSNHDQDLERDHDLDLDRDEEMDRTDDHDRIKDKGKHQQTKNLIGSLFSHRQSREPSSNSSDDYHDQVKEQLEISSQRREELQKEISQFEEKLKAKQQLVSDLHIKSQKLVDALATVKKVTSHKQMQLTKLQRCFLQVKDYTERVKVSEQEFQSLVDLAMLEADDGEDGMHDDILYTNGKA